MKACASTLLCAALTSLAWAAVAPPPPPPAPPPPPPGAVAPPDCASPCVHKVCVPVPTVTKTDKVLYDEKCVDYCLPRCSLYSILSGHGCGCGDGGCVNCGHPRTRHVLIKRWVHEECPDTKCEVEEQLPCATGPAPLPPPLPAAK